MTSPFQFPAGRLRKTVALLTVAIFGGGIVAVWAIQPQPSVESRTTLLRPKAPVHSPILLLSAALAMVAAIGIGKEGEREGEEDPARLQEQINELAAKLQASERRVQEGKKRALESLEFAEHAGRRFQELFQGLPVACFTVDTQETVHEWNRVAEMLFEASSHEVFLKNVREALPAFNVSVLPRHQCEIYHALQGEEVFGQERSFVSESGEERWILSSAFPLKDRKGMIVGALCACIDITSRMLAEQQAEIAQEQIRSILEAAGDPVISISADGQIEWFNPAACRCFGYSLKEVMGRPVAMLMPEGMRADHERYVSNAVAAPERTRVIGLTRELTAVRKDGSEFPVELSLRKGQAGSKVFFTAVLRDITQRREMERQIETHAAQVNNMLVQLELQTLELEEANSRLASLATTDGLTGLTNHRTFKEQLANHFQEAVLGTSLCLLLMDIDHFKSFNDTFGHQAGDAVLKVVAEALRTTVGDVGAVARYGGEEFAVILPELGVEAARIVAEEIRLAIEQTPCEYRQITISVGLSSYTPDTSVPDDLVQRADIALYASKRQGRNQVTLFEPGIEGAA